MSHFCLFSKKMVSQYHRTKPNRCVTDVFLNCLFGIQTHRKQSCLCGVKDACDERNINAGLFGSTAYKRKPKWFWHAIWFQQLPPIEVNFFQQSQLLTESILPWPQSINISQTECLIKINYLFCQNALINLLCHRNNSTSSMLMILHCWLMTMPGDSVSSIEWEWKHFLGVFCSKSFLVKIRK